MTLSAELSLATSAIESSKVVDESNTKLAMLANLKIPEKGDYYRCGPEDAAVYDDKGLTMVVGKLGARKTVGPILAFTSYRRDTSQDMVAGLAVQILYRTPLDSNGKFSEYEAWIIISENNAALCELVSKPEPTIWDDDEEMPAKPEETAASSSAGSGTLKTTPEDEKQQVTASVSSTSPLNKEEFKALMANMQELEEAEALVAEPEAPPTSSEAAPVAAPVEKRRKRAKNKIDPKEYAKEDPYLQIQHLQELQEDIIAEDQEQEELVSAEYLKQLIDAHDAKLRKEARQNLLKVSWDDDDGTASKKTQQLSTKTEDPKDRLSKDSAKELTPEEKKAK